MIQLHLEAEQGNVNEVTNILDSGVPVDTRDPKTDLTALFIAVCSEKAGPDMVRLLLEHGADPNAEGPDPTLVEYIDAIENMDSDSYEFETVDVLESALRHATLDKVKLLLDAGAELDSEVLLNAANSGFIGESGQLLELVDLLLDRGASPCAVSDDGESALGAASERAHFDVVSRLLRAGADPELLEWNELMFAIALGTVDDVERLLAQGQDITVCDSADRTPFALSLDTEDWEKAELVLSAGGDLNGRDRCGATPLISAAEDERTELLTWLIDHGADLDAKNDFGSTALVAAAERGATECVRRLIAGGADVTIMKSRLPLSDEVLSDLKESLGTQLPDANFFDKFNQRMGDLPDEPVMALAANLEIARMLQAAGADFSDINDDVRAELTGLETEGEVECSPDEYAAAKHRRFGTSNPERMNNPFWEAMVRSGATAYAAQDTFGDTGNYQDPPVWCFHRFGRSLTELPDGRIIEIGGEHEDHYDPNFCIYNEVLVHHGGGRFDIYGYPEEVFPPTDNHTATLVGDFIYIIGCLGYPEDRRSGSTPVHRLNIQTLVMEKVDTSGDNPGWVWKHKAAYVPNNSPEGEIRVSGGELYKKTWGKEKYSKNADLFVLNLATMRWSRSQK